jgi:cytoskeletal protein RodZ
MTATSGITQKRKWILQLILLILLFLLLALGIWLYYDLKLRQIKSPDNNIGTKKDL